MSDDDCPRVRVEVGMRFSMPEVGAMLDPEQTKAFMAGLAEIVAATGSPADALSSLRAGTTGGRK